MLVPEMEAQHGELIKIQVCSMSLFFNLQLKNDNIYYIYYITFYQEKMCLNIQL